jgi:hypothetical protein
MSVLIASIIGSGKKLSAGGTNVSVKTFVPLWLEPETLT